MIKEGPSISVDVSKSGVAYQGWLSYGKPHGKARKADMTRTGLSAIKALADDLGAKDGVVVPVAYEDTGIYSKPLRMFLSESGMVEAVMSPLLSAKVRKADDKPIKTDMRDCASIAEAYYTKDKVRIAAPTVGQDALKQLSKSHQTRKAELRKAKERFRKNLDEVWPFWDSVFADPYRNGPWAMVSKYRHPYVLARKRKADVVALLEANGIHGKRADAMAEKAIAYAKDCVSGALESSPEVESLGRWMAGVESAAAEDAAVMGKMVAMLEGNRDFEHLKEIRGIGASLAAIIVAELGDAFRFGSAKAVVSYAGLNPMVCQSGKMTGRHLPITKKGNARLRWALVMAVRVMGLTDADNKVTRFRDHLINENRLSSEAAIVAASSKLLRIIYSMMKSGQPFEQD